MLNVRSEIKATKLKNRAKIRAAKAKCAVPTSNMEDHEAFPDKFEGRERFYVIINMANGMWRRNTNSLMPLKGLLDLEDGWKESPYYKRVTGLAKLFLDIDGPWGSLATDLSYRQLIAIRIALSGCKDIKLVRGCDISVSSYSPPPRDRYYR